VWFSQTELGRVFMEKVFRVIEAISEWTGKLASFLMAGLVVAICYDVAMRYVFNKPTAW